MTFQCNCIPLSLHENIQKESCFLIKYEYGTQITGLVGATVHSLEKTIVLKKNGARMEDSWKDMCEP